MDEPKQQQPVEQSPPITFAEAVQLRMLASWQVAAILARHKAAGLSPDSRLPPAVIDGMIKEALHGAL